MYEELMPLCCDSDLIFNAMLIIWSCCFQRIFFFDLFRFYFHTRYLENGGSEHRIVIYRRDGNQKQTTKCKKEDMKLEDDVNIPASINVETFRKLYRKVIHNYEQYLYVEFSS